jgi:hypothetical protein
MTVTLLSVLSGLAAGNLAAQSADKSRDEDKGYTFYEQFQGSSNTLGQVMKFDTSAGYNFNRWFGVDVGVPAYVVRASSTSTTTTSTTTSQATNSGIGDAYVDLRFTFNVPLINYASTVTGRAPTGDSASGLSTGRATFDWNNRLEGGLLGLRPFVNLGVANSVSDTHFFVRPFTTLGMIGHFEGGASYKVLPFCSVGASLYDVLPSGQQKVFSKLMKRKETTGGADLTRDNGFSTWFDASPIPFLDFEVGYDRSVHYDLNTVSFGVGFNIGSLVNKLARPF